MSLAQWRPDVAKERFLACAKMEQVRHFFADGSYSMNVCASSWSCGGKVKAAKAGFFAWRSLFFLSSIFVEIPCCSGPSIAGAAQESPRMGEGVCFGRNC